MSPGMPEQHRRHAQAPARSRARPRAWPRRSPCPSATATAPSSRARLPSSSGRPALRAPWIALLQLRFQPRVLLARQVAGAARVDQRARRPCGVVEQRLVPGAGRVVDVDGIGRRLDRAHAVVVVDGMKEPHVQDRAHARRPARPRSAPSARPRNTRTPPASRRGRGSPSCGRGAARAIRADVRSRPTAST